MTASIGTKPGALTIRAARADDADRAVPLIHSSGPTAFDYVFADARADAQTFLRRAFVDGHGEFGWRNHVVAERDGRLLAVGSGFARSDMRGFTLAAARQIIGHYGWRAAGPVLRGLRTEHIIRPPAESEFYIGHVAVAPTARGQGIGSALMSWFATEARRRSLPRLVLDVAADNPRAQALYTRLGFRVVTTRIAQLANAHGAVPTQHRMMRAAAN
ncbi:MAG TPA: N-acetyltransferase [Rhodanobacteraceae bacterium]|nr:N-acetyltransferase [Rhodanobacteraceae bacterium]